MPEHYYKHACYGGNIYNMADIVREYSNGEITVVWQAAKCIHAGSCFRELPEVFDPSERPWIKMDGSNTDRIIKQVKRCPTDALTYHKNEPKPMEKQESKTEVEVLKDGPVLIKGNIELTDQDGSVSNTEGVVAICRCGVSKTKPFCDGSHHSIAFKDERD